jgi:hypothetical protein
VLQLEQPFLSWYFPSLETTLVNMLTLFGMCVRIIEREVSTLLLWYGHTRNVKIKRLGKKHTWQSKEARDEEIILLRDEPCQNSKPNSEIFARNGKTYVRFAF